MARESWTVSFYEEYLFISMVEPKMGTSTALHAILLYALVVSAAFQRPPGHLWPLSNSSLYNDVFGGANVRHDVTKKCFMFTDGPKALPYSVLRVEEEQDASYDVTLDGKSPLQDLTLSFYVYPENDASDISGTILHYQVEDREILRIRALANTFLVAFRDEYGMSAGTMYLVNFFTPRAWNHVTLSRAYETGQIAVYKDGVEMYNEDDEFSDVISFPNGGSIRIGKSHEEDNEDSFDGNFACVQLYQRLVPGGNLSDVENACLPENWKKGFDYYYEDVEDMKCLTDPPRLVRPDPYVSPVVSMGTLSSQSQWIAFLQRHGLEDSGRISGYWRKKSIDNAPEVKEDLIGSFNATSKMVCARLCMRVNSCQAFLVGANAHNAGLKECGLFDNQQSNFVDSVGSEYYEVDD